MARNDQITRQWHLLRQLEASSGLSLTQLVDHLPDDYQKNPRTVRRDLEALEAVVGFYRSPNTVTGAVAAGARPSRVYIKFDADVLHARVRVVFEPAVSATRTRVAGHAESYGAKRRPTRENDRVICLAASGLSAYPRGGRRHSRSLSEK